jgi:1-acyl-sn-glycerol-3-phosphate acyltransferase
MTDITSVEPWLYWTLFPVHRMFLSLYFRSIDIQGLENLPEQGPMILASKHFSRWDPLVLSLLSTEPLRFMTNANQFEGLQGWLIERLGAFPVNLSRPTVSSLRGAIELIHQGRKLVIFPEGGIVRDQPLRTFKPGLARLVLQAEAMALNKLEVPIVPIALRYDPAASFRAKICVYITSPIYTHQYQQDSDKQTAQAITEALYAAILQNLESPRNCI